MANTWICQLLGITLVCVALSHCELEGRRSVVLRDTDKISAIREKIGKLNELLSSLDEDEEKDLDLLAHPDKANKEPKQINKTSEPVSENMGQSKTGLQQRRPVQTSNEKSHSNALRSKDNAINILAKALTKLNQPKYNTVDSAGEDENEEQNSKEMETMIGDALTELSQGKAVATSSENNGRQEGSAGTSQLREEVISAVENRLVQDMALATKLGISVKELINHIDKEAIRDANIQKLEKELAALDK